MVRPTVANSQKCKDCGEADRDNSRYAGPRCLTCHRAWKAASKRKRDKRFRIEKLSRNDELAKEGRRVCVKCYKVRHLAEFRTSQPHRKGKINKLCDQCLSQMYSYKGEGLDYKYWRRRAYSVNSAARIRLANKLNQPTSSVSLEDLSYECKPQELVAMYDKDDKCHYCRVLLTSDNLSVDHVNPVSRGGENNPDNLVLCCGACNRLKFDRTLDEFVTFMAEYAKNLTKAVEQRDKQPAG